MLSSPLADGGFAMATGHVMPLDSVMIGVLGSPLADGGFAVAAGHVMPLDSVTVEVVEDGQAVFVTLAVVGLATAGAGQTKHNH